MQPVLWYSGTAFDFTCAGLTPKIKAGVWCTSASVPTLLVNDVYPSTIDVTVSPSERRAIGDVVSPNRYAYRNVHDSTTSTGLPDASIALSPAAETSGADSVSTIRSYAAKLVVPLTL